ncbi:chemotaxis protein CheB [Flexivirga lutea]
MLVVLHLPPSGSSMLASILDKSGPLPVVTAADRDALEHGRIVVAPPDHHLVVTDAHSTITRGPHENGTRPAVDVLFRSAARAWCPRVVGVILSGALDDGTAGMEAIRQRGGAVLAQSPDDAAYPSMPSSVIQNVGADMIGTAAELADMVNDLARPGQAAGFSCPDCNGSLFQIHDGDLVRFRCRVGHAWSSLALMAAQSESLDSALWMALRSLEDKAALSDQLADRAAERGNTLSRQRFLEKAAEARRSARVLQRLLEQPLSTPLAEEATQEEHVHRP